MVLYYREHGLETETVKVFNGIAIVGASGQWEIDYSHVGFREVHTVQATPEGSFDSAAETATGASVYFVNNIQAKGQCLKGTGVGLLAGFSLLWETAGSKIHVTVTGI